MKTMAVGELKAHFSEVLEEVKKGHSVAVGYGKRKTRVAVIIPYDEYEATAARRLGVMEDRATYKVKKGFSISDDELLSS